MPNSSTLIPQTSWAHPPQPGPPPRPPPTSPWVQHHPQKRVIYVFPVAYPLSPSLIPSPQTFSPSLTWLLGTAPAPWHRPHSTATLPPAPGTTWTSPTSASTLPPGWGSFTSSTRPATLPRLAGVGLGSGLAGTAQTARAICPLSSPKVYPTSSATQPTSRSAPPPTTRHEPAGPSTPPPPQTVPTGTRTSAAQAFQG